jgi:UDP-perosamine 4-acetyltransferase
MCVLIEAIRMRHDVVIAALLDADASLWGSALMGVPVLGPDDNLQRAISDGVTHFVVGVGGLGDTGLRARLLEAALGQGLEPISVIHPTAYVAPSAQVGRGTVVLAGAIVSTHSTIGDNVIINTGAIVDHHCHVGDHAHVATGARLGGSVLVGRNALVGAGSTIRQGISIGEAATVAAGAVVVRDVSPGSKVMGVPSRPIPNEV